MKILKIIYDWIYGAKDSQINTLTFRMNDLIKENLNLEDAITDIRFTIKRRENEIEMLKSRLNIDSSKTPDFLDTRSSYPVTIQYVKNGPKPVVSSFTIPAKEIYCSFNALEELTERKKLRELDLNKKLLKIWDIVINRCRYEFDYKESWHYPATTYFRKKGDCEDTTILFLTLCKLAGVPSDRVFNACGWYSDKKNRYGHSYPICKMEDDKWYIFESTLNKTPKHPILFKGSHYTADWGLSNYNFAGKLKKGSYENGKAQI